MTSTSGGEAIVNGLVAHGVDTVFGLPGAQIYGLFDAFHQAQLKVIGARHEQACGYMAFGYARSSGRPGVFSVVPGPGVLNASAWYGLGFNAALEGNGLANDHPGCVQGRVYLTNQFGLSYHVLPVVMKVVNAILSLFGVPKIPADGGIEGGAPLGPGLRGEYCP